MRVLSSTVVAASLRYSIFVLTMATRGEISPYQIHGGNPPVSDSVKRNLPLYRLYSLLCPRPAERLAFAQGALDGPASKKPHLEGAPEEEQEELPECDFEKARPRFMHDIVIYSDMKHKSVYSCDI